MDFDSTGLQIAIISLVNCSLDLKKKREINIQSQFVFTPLSYRAKRIMKQNLAFLQFAHVRRIVRYLTKKTRTTPNFAIFCTRSRLFVAVKIVSQTFQVNFQLPRIEVVVCGKATVFRFHFARVFVCNTG